MRRALRLVTVLLIACGAAVAAPGVAQAGSGCSLVKTIPNSGGSTYQYCSDNTAATNKWTNWVIVDANQHIWVDVQVNLRIDGKDHFLPTQGWILEGVEVFDPYNQVYRSTRIVQNSCTNGHTYFPILRMKMHDGVWGPWAGAHQFVC
jgi:hypothetical protein